MIPFLCIIFHLVIEHVLLFNYETRNLELWHLTSAQKQQTAEALWRGIQSSWGHGEYLAEAAWAGRVPGRVPGTVSGTQDPAPAGAFREEPVLSLSMDDVILRKPESAY